MVALLCSHHCNSNTYVQVTLLTSHVGTRTDFLAQLLLRWLNDVIHLLTLVSVDQLHIPSLLRAEVAFSK